MAKVVFLGDQSVGKTSIIMSNSQNYSATQKPTSVLDHSNCTVNTDLGSVELNIWDTAGQEVYQALATNYIRDSNAAVIVFAKDDHLSFESLNSWYEIVIDILGENNNIFIVGNKIDLPDLMVKYEEAFDYAQKNNLQYFEVSAKTGANIDYLFNAIALSIQQANPQKVDSHPIIRDQSKTTESSCWC